MGCSGPRFARPVNRRVEPVILRTRLPAINAEGASRPLVRTEIESERTCPISNLGLLKSHLLTLDELRPFPPMMEVQAIERSRSRYDETPRLDSGRAGTFSRVSPRSFDLNSSVDPAFDIREGPTFDHIDGRACKKIGTLQFRRRTCPLWDGFSDS